MTDHRDVIAAFVDNEPVGAGDLSEALASANGREYLIDVLVLRGLVGDATRPQSPRVQGSKGPGPLVREDQDFWTVGPLDLADRSRSRRRARWLTAAAALVAASLTAGYVAGRGLTSGSTSGSPVTAETATLAVEPASSPTRPAPAPTHVIRMEKGVAWNERSGGN